MNQLTTTINNFTLEETLMQRVFEASGYQFTIITPNGGEPHFISQEVAKGLGYARNDYLTEKLKTNGFTLLKLTKENGLTLLKRVSSISKNTMSLMLIPASSLQEYLVKHSTLPKAKELGDVLYKVLASGNPVFNEEVLDDWKTSLDELQMTVPQLFDASKKVNGFIFGLVRNDTVAGRIVQGYHNNTMSHFVYNVDKERKRWRKMGVSSTLLSSRRVFLGYLDLCSRRIIAFLDDMFIKEVTELVEDCKSKGFTDRQTSDFIFKKKNKDHKPIVELVDYVIKKYAHVIKTFYFMDETGMMEEKKEEFLFSQYVNENDRQIRDRLIVEEGMKLNRLVIEDWSSKELHDETIHKLIAQKKKVS